MNGLKEREKEKKQKLKQLEAEIKEMKRDHKETFEIMSRPALGKKTPPTKQLVCAAVGALILLAAVIWLYIFPPTFDRYAIFRLGTLRFTRTVFFLPLALSSIALILCKKRKRYIISFFPSAIIAIIGASVTTKAELLTYPVWVYTVAYSGIFIGIGLLLFAAFLNKR